MTPDGTAIVFDRFKQNSNIMLIEFAIPSRPLLREGANDVPASDDVSRVQLEVAHQNGRLSGVNIAANASMLVEMSAKGSAGCMMSSTGPFRISGFLTIAEYR